MMNSNSTVSHDVAQLNSIGSRNVLSETNVIAGRTVKVVQTISLQHMYNKCRFMEVYHLNIQSLKRVCKERTNYREGGRYTTRMRERRMD